jgi:hypothetical protein
LDNGNTAYLEPGNISNPTIQLELGKAEKWVIAFNATKNGSALFEVTKDKHLMLESKIAGRSHNLLGMSAGSQNVVDGSEVLGQVTGVLEGGKGEKGFSPAFYIDMGDCSLALEEKIPSGIKFFSVAWKEEADSFLMLATEKVANKCPGIHQLVNIFAEVVFEILVERNSLQAFRTDTNIVCFVLFNQQMFICCLSHPTSGENFRENY